MAGDILDALEAMTTTSWQSLEAGQKITAKDLQAAIDKLSKPRGAFAGIVVPTGIPIPGGTRVSWSFFSDPADPVAPLPSSYLCPHASLWKRR